MLLVIKHPEKKLVVPEGSLQTYVTLVTILKGEKPVWSKLVVSWKTVSTNIT